MRALGIGPVGTLVASGKLGHRDRLIIADFDNQTRDRLLGPALTQAFRVDFAQSRLVSPVEPDYVRRILARMQRPESTVVHLSLAREIAEREGFKAVVAGTLQQVGPSLLVSAELVSAKSGEVLATARETARDSSMILTAVDRVSKRLRERIGESLTRLRADPRLEDVTTGSLDALREYSEAVQAENDNDLGRAVDLLEDAVAADSSFAMAWRKLGVSLINDLRSTGRATEALTRAYQLRDRLTFRERKLTENSYYVNVTGAMDSAVTALQSLLAAYPDDAWAHNNLGVTPEISGHRERAEGPYLRAIALEPENGLAWGNPYTARLELGRYDSAAAVLAEMRRRFSAGPRLDELGLLLPLARRDFAAAETQVRRQIARYPTDARAQQRLTRVLAGVLTVRGKLAEADRTLEKSAELTAAAGQAGRALHERARRAVPFAMYLGDSAKARGLLEAVLRSNPLTGLAEQERPIRGLLAVAVQIGDQRRAEELLQEFERIPGDIPGSVRRWMIAVTRGEVLSMREETARRAVEALRATRGPGNQTRDLTLAIAFDRLGMPDSALAAYQRWADVGSTAWDNGIYSIREPMAYLRMGELYEAKGDRARAADFYGRFTELWREADPELQPRVREVKRRLARLLAEPTS